MNTLFSIRRLKQIFFSGIPKKFRDNSFKGLGYETGHN